MNAFGNTFEFQQYFIVMQHVFLQIIRAQQIPSFETPLYGDLGKY